jgi:hypothetical protein
MIGRSVRSKAVQLLAPGAQFVMVEDVITAWRTPDIPQPTEEEISAKVVQLQLQAQIDIYRQAVQRHIDTTAQSRQYENGFALASYVTSTVPSWRAEAEVFINWRDYVWVFVFDLLSQVEAGTEPPPESPAALIEMLPSIEWPT